MIVITVFEISQPYSYLGESTGDELQLLWYEGVIELRCQLDGQTYIIMKCG